MSPSDKNVFFRLNLGNVISIIIQLVMLGVIYGRLDQRMTVLEEARREQVEFNSKQADKLQEAIINALKDNSSTSSRLGSIEYKMDYLLTNMRENKRK